MTMYVHEFGGAVNEGVYLLSSNVNSLFSRIPYSNFKFNFGAETAVSNGSLSDCEKSLSDLLYQRE